MEVAMNKTVRKAALAACSDPLAESRRPVIENLIRILEERNIAVIASPYLYGCDEPDPGRAKAQFLNSVFADPEVEFVFDVSGGDLANTVLRHLDFDAIAASKASFYGFSDLTTVINAIASQTGREAVNYQARNIAPGPVYEELLQYFDGKILQHAVSTDDLEIQFLRGSSMSGRVFGGNIRCMLKLAGTKYWPDLEGAILLLEAMSGGVSQMRTMIEQYLELGAAEKINSVLLGTFSQMEKDDLRPAIQEIVLEAFPESIPVAQTRFVGHGKDARAIVIGREESLRPGL